MFRLQGLGLRGLGFGFEVYGFRGSRQGALI